MINIPKFKIDFKRDKSNKSYFVYYVDYFTIARYIINGYAGLIKELAIAVAVLNNPKIQSKDQIFFNNEKYHEIYSKRFHKRITLNVQINCF